MDKGNTDRKYDDRQWGMTDNGEWQTYKTGDDRQLINRVKDNAEWQTIGNDRQWVMTDNGKLRAMGEW